VAPRRSATSRTAGCSVTFGIPGNAEPSGKKGTSEVLPPRFKLDSTHTWANNPGWFLLDVLSVFDFEEHGDKYDYYGIVLVANSALHATFPEEVLQPSLGDRSPTRLKAHTAAEGDAFVLDLIARQPLNRGDTSKPQSWMLPMPKASMDPRSYWLPYVAFLAVKKGYVPLDHLQLQPSVVAAGKRAREEDAGERVVAPRLDAATAAPPPHPQEDDGDAMEQDG